MQTDPIGYYDTMNLYQYCGNNPVNYIDPTGTDRYILVDAAGLHHWIGVDEWAQRGDGTWYKTGRIIQQSIRSTNWWLGLVLSDGEYTQDSHGNQSFRKIRVKSGWQEDMALLHQLNEDMKDESPEYGFLTSGGLIWKVVEKYCNNFTAPTECIPYSYSYLYTGINDGHVRRTRPGGDNIKLMKSQAKVALEVAKYMMDILGEQMNKLNVEKHQKCKKK